MPRSSGSPVGRPVYPDRPSRRRAVLAWCLYDFGSSSYTTLIMTVAFAVYFREVVVQASGNRGDALWGRANFLAMLLVALSAPLVGAIADHAGRKKRFLVLATLLTFSATALLYFVGPGDILPAMLLYVLATVGFEGGYVFYNAFLPEIATPRSIGRVSGWAWGAGYVGGLSALVLCYPFIGSELRDAAGALRQEALQDRRLSFVIVAAFFLLFALPLVRWLRETPGAAGPAPPASWLREGFARVGSTLRRVRQQPQVSRFILASVFFNDGITTIIVFSATYATVTFGFGSAELVKLFVVLNVVAVPGALLAGHLADAIGARRTLLLTLVLWIAVVLAAALARERSGFWWMAVGAAIGMGSTQAVGRSFMAQLSPPDREAEFFGFYVLSGKFASIFGPLIFGIVSAWSGSQRLAVVSLLPLFVAGLGILLTVEETRAPSVEDR